MKFRYFIALPILSLLFSCETINPSGEDDKKHDEFVSESHTVSGKIEKGPMVRGSSVEMRTLDKFLVPTGASYSTNIENNKGEFSFGELKIASPYAKLTANGFFFNEVKGELSTAQIALDAIVDLSDNTTINVNVLTHLISQRIIQLVNGYDKSFKDANKQAQEELLTQFGLQEYSGKDVSQFSIMSGDDAASALIVISSYILSDRSEAEIVEFLSVLSSEFSRDGKFSDETKERLKSTKNYLNGRLETISDNIVNRYNEIGFEVTVKDLANFIDWNNDGIAGNEIEDSEIKLSQTELNVPLDGGQFSITIDSDTPYYYLEPPTYGSNQTPDVGYVDGNYFSDLYQGNPTAHNIEYSKSIKDNVISINVNPARFKADKYTSFSVYNARGKIIATILINQKGNPNYHVEVPLLGESGSLFFLNIMENMRNAYQKVRNLEGRYIRAEVKTPYLATDSDVLSAWTYFYASISRLAFLRDADMQQLGCYQPYVETFMSLLYYTLSSTWGGVPFYVDNLDNVQQGLPRTSEEEVLTNIALMLESAIPQLEEKANDSRTDANSIFFVSKDVARVILAYTYCNLKKFDKALPLLETVINNGFYSLAYADMSTIRKDYCFNSECIFGFILPTRSIMIEEEACIPCLDYIEVYLTCAECLYNLGRTEEANYYVAKVESNKNLVLSADNILEAIAKWRYELQSSNFLAFIRRNNLGESYLGLESTEFYQLLLPIPLQEMQTNPNMTQNEGY